MMRKPNILLFITDQHKADHLGVYGNKIVKTPNLDAIARRGWRADRFYVASPICMPNRSSLMTGRMPSVHGARHNGIPLALESVTFVDRLREAGYETALVGKSHLQNMTGKGPHWPGPADPPMDGEARRAAPGNYDQEWGPLWRRDPAHDLETPFYGFSRVALAVDHGDQVWGHYWRWLEKNHPEAAATAGPEHAIPTPDYELSRCGQAWRTRVPEELSTSAYIGNEARSLIREYAQAGKPFFMMCSFPDPHHPFTPHGKYWDMYGPEAVDLPESFHACAEHEAAPPVQWLYRQRDEGKAVKSTPALFACTEREAREGGLDVRVATMPAKAVPRARTLAATDGLLKVVIENGTDRIIGAAVLAANGGEVMTAIQMAMLGGLTAGQVRDAVIAHPTMAEGLNTLLAG